MWLEKHREEREILKGFMDTTQQTFDNAYWASQTPDIQALKSITDPVARGTAAGKLAMQGVAIDVPIMVWGWDAYITMSVRAQLGYTWVPSALQQPITIAPGLVQVGVAPYDPTHPPSGSIKVSTNLADYPPYKAPVALPGASAIADPVGVQSFGNIYITVPGDNSPGGTTFTDSRGTFVKEVVQTPFGFNSWWEKVS